MQCICVLKEICGFISLKSSYEEKKITLDKKPNLTQVLKVSISTVKNYSVKFMKKKKKILYSYVDSNSQVS